MIFGIGILTLAVYFLFFSTGSDSDSSTRVGISDKIRDDSFHFAWCDDDGTTRSSDGTRRHCITGLISEFAPISMVGDGKGETVLIFRFCKGERPP